ncbi:hypothetical protein GCM10009612_72450 [Streptomyces beijiangensis]
MDGEWFSARQPESGLRNEAIAPRNGGCIVIDGTGDRKDGTVPAHVGQQWLRRLGKTRNGLVACPWSGPAGGLPMRCMRSCLSPYTICALVVDREVVPAVPGLGFSGPTQDRAATPAGWHGSGPESKGSLAGDGGQLCHPTTVDCYQCCVRPEWLTWGRSSRAMQLVRPADHILQSIPCAPTAEEC